MSNLKCSEILTTVVENLNQIIKDLEECCAEIYDGPDSEICDLAGTRIEEFGRKLRREVCFIEKLSEGAKILEEKV